MLSHLRGIKMAENTDYTTKSFIVIGTHGADHPEKATMTFACAGAAQSIGIKTKVFLAGDAVQLARKGFAKTLPKVEGMAPVDELMHGFMSGGGKVQVCIPCMESRGISKVDFMEGIEFMNLMDFAAATVGADKVFTC